MKCKSVVFLSTVVVLCVVVLVVAIAVSSKNRNNQKVPLGLEPQPSENLSSEYLSFDCPSLSPSCIEDYTRETQEQQAVAASEEEVVAPQSYLPLSYVPGNLVVEENGLRLSEGLTSRIIARTGERVQYDNGGESEINFHIDPDHSVVFRDMRASNFGGWIMVNNAEEDDGQGGVGAITFDSQGRVIDYKMLLEGTSNNCGGGRTPWETFVSCEETAGGVAWQVDPTGERPPEIITLGNDGGEFESFAYWLDRRELQFFMTEDVEEGAMQRFRPDSVNWDDPWSILHGSGTRDFLLLDPDSGTFSWTFDRDAAKENAMEFYPNSEGIDVAGDMLYFVSKVFRRLYMLNLLDGTYTSQSTDHGAFEGEPDQVQRIVGMSDSLLFFTEDGDIPGIHARDTTGQYYTIMESEFEDDETTGLAFSPDGLHMYFGIQNAGMIYDVTRLDGRPFYAMSLNIRYHGTWEA